MVEVKIFLKLAKNGENKYKVESSLKPIIGNLWSNADKRTRIALPTADFAIEVNIPDEKFDIEKIAVAKINFELEEERLVVKAVDNL